MTQTMVLEPPPPVRGSDFAQLNRLISAAGLLERRPGYYAVRLSLVGLAYIGGLVAFVLLGDSWWQLVTAAFMAIVFAQTRVGRARCGAPADLPYPAPSQTAGLFVGNLGIGMSYGWWMDKHTRHHANPNHDDHRPDVSPDILVWSTGPGPVRHRRRPLHRPAAGVRVLPAAHPRRPQPACRQRPRADPPALRMRTVLEAVLLGMHFVGYLVALFVRAAAGHGARLLRDPPGRCSASTSAARSRPTTRACRSRPRRSGLPAQAGADLTQRLTVDASSTSCSAG